MSVWDRREEILYGNGSADEVDPTPLHSGRSMALSAVTVECVSDLLIPGY